MRIKVAHDARPQVRTLLIATLVTVALWFVPLAEVLTYPFRIFVTFIHEGGHAIAALLTGNHVYGLNVAMNASGATYTTHGGLFSQLFIASAGYLSAMLYGALLLVLIRRTIAARLVLLGSAGLVLALTLRYSLVGGFANGLFDLFTLLAGTLLTLGLVVTAKYASARVANFLVSFLAVQCVLNALLDLKTVFFLASPFAPSVPTDAVHMAEATGIPAIVWAALWIGAAFLILSLALRAYAANRRAARQPDLPFEDPLDV